MLRFVGLNVLVLVVIFLWAQPARADIWDWMEELTAPGPFHSRGNLTATVYCPGTAPVGSGRSPPNIKGAFCSGLLLCGCPPFQERRGREIFPFAG